MRLAWVVILAILAVPVLGYALTCPPVLKPTVNPYATRIFTSERLIDARVGKDVMIALLDASAGSIKFEVKIRGVTRTIVEEVPGFESSIMVARLTPEGLEAWVEANLPYKYTNISLLDELSNIAVAFGDTRFVVFAYCSDPCINILASIDACSRVLDACVYGGRVYAYLEDGRVLAYDPLSGVLSVEWVFSTRVKQAMCIPVYTARGVWSSRYALVLLENGTLLLFDHVDAAVLTKFDDGVSTLLHASYEPSTATIYAIYNAAGGYRIASYTLGSQPVHHPTVCERGVALQGLAINGVYAASLKSKTIIINLKSSRCFMIPGFTVPLITWPPRVQTTILLYDPRGMLRDYLVDEPEGLWVRDWGLPAKEGVKRLAGYAWGFIYLLTLHSIYAIPAKLVETELVSVKAGMLFAAKPVEFKMQVTCLYGVCRGIVQTVTVSSTRLEVVPLPPGVYYVRFESPYATLSFTTRIPSYSICRPLVATDPEILQSNLVVRIASSRLEVCVVSIGDPQGFGFARGPVPNASVVIRSRLGYAAENTTGADGCTIFDSIPPGAYEVYVVAPGFEPASARLEVRANESLVATIHVKPLTSPVDIQVVDAQYGFRVPNATITIRDVKTGKVVVTRQYKLLLPQGAYEVCASHPYYTLGKCANVTVKPGMPLNVTIALTPVTYRVELHVHLAETVAVGKKIPVTIEYVRVEPIRTSPVRVTEIVENVSKIIVFELPWGVYRVAITAPFHEKLVLTVKTPPIFHVDARLSTINYTVIIETYDAVTNQAVYNARVEIIGAAGFHLVTQSFKRIELPVGNYTVRITAPYYATLATKVSILRDTRLSLKLTPRTLILRVFVEMGKNKVVNATVVLEGRAFNGQEVYKRGKTDRTGVVEFRVPPGNYTITAWVVVFGFNITGSTNIKLEKSESVTLRLAEPMFIMLLSMLPYIIILVVLVVMAVLILYARRALMERIHRLKQAFIERFGRPPLEGEEEELF